MKATLFSHCDEPSKKQSSANNLRLHRRRFLKVAQKCCNRYFAIFAFLITLVLHGCASNTPRRIFVYPGVDSTAVEIADSLGQDVFIDWEQEQLAKRKADSALVFIEKSDELWAMLAKDSDTNNFNPADTLQGIEKFNQGIENLDQVTLAETDSNLNDTDRRERILEMSLAARANLEEAIRLNPYDEHARFVLSAVYETLAQRFLQDHYWGSAAEVLLLLIKMNGGQHVYFAKLGECFANLNAWQRALEYYKKAEHVLRETAAFDIPDEQAISEQTIAAVLDSSSLFLYVYYQTLAHLRLYNEDSSRIYFSRARDLARDERSLGLVDFHHRWALWDNWNLPASDLHDSLQTFIHRGGYQQAADGYKLLLQRGKLRTPRARQEAKWRLANLEFQFLNLQDSAIVRMKQIMDFYRTDSTGIAQAKSDTLLQEYTNTYGVMCYNTGLQALEIPDREKALPYFIQSAAVPWSQQAKAHLEIAKMLLNDPDRALPFAEHAYKLSEQLNTQELQDTLRILVQVLRRKQRFAEARQYLEQLHNVK